MQKKKIIAEPTIGSDQYSHPEEFSLWFILNN